MDRIVFEYGELPLHIRFLFLFIGFVGMSAILQSFVLVGTGLHLGIHIGGIMSMAAVVTFGSMRNLKRRSISSYRNAILLFAGMPIYYLYIALSHTEIASTSKGLIYWWPFVNSIFYVICIISIANKSTYDFYNVKP